MARKRPALAGDQIGEALAAAAAGPLEERARSGGTDPQSLEEFLAYDIPFRTEPAVNVVFPAEAHTGERPRS